MDICYEGKEQDAEEMLEKVESQRKLNLCWKISEDLSDEIKFKLNSKWWESQPSCQLAEVKVCVEPRSWCLGIKIRPVARAANERAVHTEVLV